MRKFASSSKFIAREKFVVDTSDKATVKISSVRGDFTNWFLSGEGKIESCETEHSAEELGEDTLSGIYYQMQKQGRGETGALLNDGHVNLLYVRDQNGTLRAVYLTWFDGGWYVHAIPVESVIRLRRGGGFTCSGL